ncbi:hypothetical protein D3C79_1040720 [compost metagenome]
MTAVGRERINRNPLWGDAFFHQQLFKAVTFGFVGRDGMAIRRAVATEAAGNKVDELAVREFLGDV